MSIEKSGESTTGDGEPIKPEDIEKNPRPWEEKVISESEWKKILTQRVEGEGEIILNPLLKKRVEDAIEVGAKWVAEQAIARPESAGLCLEYISKHITRRAHLLASEEPSETEGALSTLFFLSERLEKIGIDTPKVSIEILEKMTEKSHQKQSFRQNIPGQNEKKSKQGD